MNLNLYETRDFEQRTYRKSNIRHYGNVEECIRFGFIPRYTDFYTGRSFYDGPPTSDMVYTGQPVSV